LSPSGLRNGPGDWKSLRRLDRYAARYANFVLVVPRIAVLARIIREGADFGLHPW